MSKALNVPVRPVDSIFGGRREAIATGTCVSCTKNANKFDDELSRKDYEITGLCQTCQNEVYA